MNMKYDLEVLVPVSSKCIARLNYFKKFGLANIKDRKVLLNVILSNDEVPDVEKGWHKNIDINVVRYKNKCHVANLYKFYVDIDLNKFSSRWLVRLDDDSCTDVDGLVSNLDLYYDYRTNFYLGDLHHFSRALGGEGHVFEKYKNLLEEYEKIAPFIKNEIECGILSNSALINVLSNERSRKLLEFRSDQEGGFGDCVVALAAAMTKIYPIDCPFITHRPLVHEFSTLGGIYNHIHMISPEEDGENFADRVSPLALKLLMKSISNSPTELESKIMGSRFLQETEHVLRMFEFKDNYSLSIKFERDLRGWYEEEGKIIILNYGEVEYELKLEEDNLSGDIFLKRL
jgi:hypothetical protein